MEDKAHDAFAGLAIENEIVGKKRERIIEIFGMPSRVYESNGSEVLVYIPGSRWLLWRSECKVNINTNTGVVLSWQVRSD